ncbi:MAG TPA: hypothetical protein VJZ27_17420, partial [Aggregatilineales bacterium]|nr:hypothetical protein [Aggregatilineales bacterium]
MTIKNRQTILVTALYLITPVVCIFLYHYLLAYLWNTGENVPSDDHIFRMPLFDSILSGTYDWSHLFRDTYIRGHLFALPTLFELLLAELIHWNIFIELYAGLLLLLMRLFLYFDALTHWHR